MVHDIDVSSSREGRNATDITSRSYHPGIVNVLRMDGSVRSIDNSIQRSTWQALGTRAGAEVLPRF